MPATIETKYEKFKIVETSADREITLFSVTQATRATFPNLYFANTFLFFIQNGSKKVICPKNGEVVAKPGDMMVVPQGLSVTLENRPILGDHYQATGVCLPDALVNKVFAPSNVDNRSSSIQMVTGGDGQPFKILSHIKDVVEQPDLPAPVKQHRMLEPLIWLKWAGVTLSAPTEEQPFSQVWQLIEGNLSFPWRTSDVADSFAMSEATFRRWLASSGHQFSKILLNARLEKGLSLLQSTKVSVSEIAFECGFKTPSHFSSSFRKRFGVMPRQIRSVKH